MHSKILYTSFPRTGTVWTEKILIEYLDSIDFNYSITSHHSLWTPYPMDLHTPITRATVEAAEICFHKRRRNHKRTIFSNLERFKIAYSDRASEVEMLCNIFDTYVNYHRRWSSYINKYPHTRPIYHEDMLEQKEDYLSPILKDSGIYVDKDKLKKCFDKYSTKKAVSKVHIKRQGEASLGNHMIQYLEPDYEERYEKFLDEWAEKLDDKLERFEIDS